MDQAIFYRYLYIIALSITYMGVIIMQKKMVRIIVLVVVFLTAVVPMAVDASHVRCSRSFIIPKTFTESIARDNYDMIIIAPSDYSSTLEPFIAHKNDLGIVTTFVSTNDIYSGTYFEVKGRDNQEKIKYFIKDAIESWGITYVLFVGTYKQVPVRYCYNNDSEPRYPEPKFISELYYADIYDENGEFSSWDSNGDEIYGKWDGEVAEDKPINLTPDVCLGRLACVDTDELEIVVSKIINYEKQPADPSWFKRLVVAGGDTYQKFEGYEGEQYNQMAIDAVEGLNFNTIKLWASTGKLKNGGDIVEEINKGCGFWYLSGHGSSELWATYDPDHIMVGKFGVFQTLFLSNSHKLPVCLVGGCHNSEFDITTSNYVKDWNRQKWMKECWSWRLVSKPDGGSIATIGATGLDWYSCEFDGGGTDWLNIQFFKEYAKDIVTIGQIWKNALTLCVETFPIDWDTPSGDNSSIQAKTIQEWTLLGDPSLTIGGGTGSTNGRDTGINFNKNMRFRFQWLIDLINGFGR